MLGLDELERRRDRSPFALVLAATTHRTMLLRVFVLTHGVEGNRLHGDRRRRGGRLRGAGRGLDRSERDDDLGRLGHFGFSRLRGFALARRAIGSLRAIAASASAAAAASSAFAFRGRHRGIGGKRLQARLLDVAAGLLRARSALTASRCVVAPRLLALALVAAGFAPSFAGFATSFAALAAFTLAFLALLAFRASLTFAALAASALAFAAAA